MSETSEFSDLFKYLEREEYPSGMTKDQKRRNIRGAILIQDTGVRI